ncbi:MAG: nicotinate mononucleotide-dependent phosphoribosyltransferase CobT, partial [Acidilobus sp.]
VLAIMGKLGSLDIKKVSLATTRWIAVDPTSNIRAIAEEVGSGVPLITANFDFSDSPYPGLAMYERGFVKEGVGAGGTAVVANMLGFDYNSLKEAVYQEYGRLLRLGKA